MEGVLAECEPEVRLSQSTRARRCYHKGCSLRIVDPRRPARKYFRRKSVLLSISPAHIRLYDREGDANTTLNLKT